MTEATHETAIRAWSAASAGAAGFGEEGDVARHYLLNPSIFALLGTVAGKCVLDAGCGQGYLSRMFARQGAQVTGVEPADGWYHYAVEREEREKLGIIYRQADLSLLTDLHKVYDAVVANMVFMDIADYQTAISNCVAALKPGGRLIFSLVHPCFEEPGSAWPEKGYVEVREYSHDHVRQLSFAPLFHRPLSAYLNLVLDLRCTLERIIEPQLQPDVAELIGNDRDAHVPSFVVIAARKGG